MNILYAVRFCVNCVLVGAATCSVRDVRFIADAATRDNIFDNVDNIASRTTCENLRNLRKKFREKVKVTVDTLANQGEILTFLNLSVQKSA